MPPGLERLDRFMARANAAYYAAHDPFADFTTSPEITQVFGEILGLWAAVSWELLGRPDPAVLVEAGPGRGTLMADALRAAAHGAPAFRSAVSVHFIETSARLQALQRAVVPDAHWHDGIDSVPREPMLFLANEFLDALPIRQFVPRSDGWSERYVEGGRFVEVPTSVDPLLRSRLPNGTLAASIDACQSSPQREGGEGRRWDVVEMCESARAFVASLASRLAARPGAALFLDYGPTQSTGGDSLQAIRAGRPVDPLSDAGTADLTAHVDFTALAAVAREAGAAVHGPVPQGVFLARLGLFQRTDRLARGQPPAKALALIDSARRLAEPDRMGRLFKAMALCHPSCSTLPGFES